MWNEFVNIGQIYCIYTGQNPKASVGFELMMAIRLKSQKITKVITIHPVGDDDCVYKISWQ